MTKEQQANGYEDDDFRTVLAELDEMDEEAAEIMASARGKVSAIRTRQKNRIKIADKELMIPPALLRAVRKQRKLEQQLQDLADDIPEDLIELYEDAAGQFSFFAPEGDEEDAQPEAPAATKAASRAKKAAQANQQAEQKDGAEVLDGLAAVH